MGHAIFKVDDNGEERFIVWSSMVDAPITFALTAKELTDYFVEEATKRAREDAADRIARARQCGSSSRGGSYTLGDIVTVNRASPAESVLSEEEIVEFYVRRKEQPGWEELKAYQKSRRQPFPVTDDQLDAPDGAEVFLADRAGWFRRSGNTWLPVDLADLSAASRSMVCLERKDSGPHVFDLARGNLTVCRECGAEEPE